MTIAYYNLRTKLYYPNTAGMFELAHRYYDVPNSTLEVHGDTARIRYANGTLSPVELRRVRVTSHRDAPTGLNYSLVHFRDEPPVRG